MKANSIFTYALLITCVTISFIYTSCNKNGDGCGITTVAANEVAILQIKNSENNDLLDPKTQGHYDTAYIKRSNPSQFISQPGASPVIIAVNYIHGTVILTLTATDQDTLNFKSETIVGKCSSYTKLSEFKYNSTVLKADSSPRGAFIAYK
jgi:hypothetical protein